MAWTCHGRVWGVLGTVRGVSGACQRCVKELPVFGVRGLSRICQACVRDLSGMCPDISRIRQGVSVICQGFVRGSPGTCQGFVRNWMGVVAGGCQRGPCCLRCCQKATFVVRSFCRRGPFVVSSFVIGAAFVVKGYGQRGRVCCQEFCQSLQGANSSSESLSEGPNSPSASSSEGPDSSSESWSEGPNSSSELGGCPNNPKHDDDKVQ